MPTNKPVVEKIHLEAPVQMLGNASSELAALIGLMSESKDLSVRKFAKLAAAPLRDLQLAEDGLRNEVCPSVESFRSQQAFEDMREHFRNHIYWEMDRRV
ncbi:MAG: hypothetical protein ACOYBQ_02930 [Fluviibacter sp.]